MNIFEPLRLSSGSHVAGSGKGCAMNVISWENGDTVITDYPACSDRMLSRIVQSVNDDLADEDGFLSAENSLIALDLGHRTVGTAYHGLDRFELKKVYVQCAVYAARKVLHLANTPKALASIEAAEKWVSAPDEENRRAAAAAAAQAYAYAYAHAHAADAAAAADYAAAAAHAAAAAAADAAAAAADYAYAYAYVHPAAAAAAAAAAADYAGCCCCVELAGGIIDLFKSLTGTEDVVFSDDVTNTAIKNMQTAGGN